MTVKFSQAQSNIILSRLILVDIQEPEYLIVLEQIPHYSQIINIADGETKENLTIAEYVYGNVVAVYVPTGRGPFAMNDFNENGLIGDELPGWEYEFKGVRIT